MYAYACSEYGGPDVLNCVRLASDMIFGGLKAGLDGKRLIGGDALESVAILRKVVDLAAGGDFHPVIDRSIGFSQAIAAQTHVDTGRKTGNVVVSAMKTSFYNQRMKT